MHTVITFVFGTLNFRTAGVSPFPSAIKGGPEYVDSKKLKKKRKKILNEMDNYTLDAKFSSIMFTFSLTTVIGPDRLF